MKLCISLLAGVLLTCTAQAQILTQIRNTGPRANRVNIIFISEGYTAAQEALFQEHVAMRIPGMLADDAWRRFADHVNIFRLFVPSLDSGIDVPDQGVTRATAFDGYYNTTTGAWGFSNPLLDAALMTHLPDYDVAVLFMNTAVGGPPMGGGGKVYMAVPPGVVLDQSGFTNVLLHEMGHAFAELADEYFSVTDTAPPVRTMRPNASSETTRERVPWASFIFPETPVPTVMAPDENTIGVFQGSSRSLALTRPSFNSRMRDSNRPWNSVCLRAFATAIHRLNLNGATAPPTITQQPVGTTVARGASVTLMVQSTGVGPLTYQWRRNGVYLPGIEPSYTIPAVTESTSGVYSVEVTNAAGPVLSANATVGITGGQPTPQAIAITQVPDHVFGAGPFTVTVTATASSGLPVNLRVASGPASLSGSTLTVTGAGIVTLAAAEVRTDNSTPATATSSFTVQRAPVTISLFDLFHVADGRPKIAGVGTTPGANVELTYAPLGSTAGTLVPYSAPGIYAVVATIVDPSYIGSRSATMFIFGRTAADAPTLTLQTRALATVGVPFNFQLGATGGVTSYSVSELPPGLRLDAATGVISGTPTAPFAQKTVGVTATNASGFDLQRLEIAVTDGTSADLTPPTVVSFGWESFSANGGAASVRLRFSEPVRNVDTRAFTPVVTGSATLTVPSIVPGTDLSEYVISVVFGGTGTASLRLNQTSLITDLSGNPLLGGGLTAPHTVGGVTPDSTLPSIVSMTLAPGATSSAGTFNVVFSENVTFVRPENFVIFGTGNTTGSVTSVTGSGTTYAVGFVFSGASGSLQLAIHSIGLGIGDLSANPFLGDGVSASAPLPSNSGPPDMTPPVVTAFTAGPPNGATVNFIVTFSEPVNGVGSSDFTPLTTGTATAAIGAVSGSGATYTIPVTTTGSGTVQLRLVGGATTAITDLTGHVLASAALSPAAMVNGNVDTAAPTIVSFAASAGSTASFALSFNEPVTGVSADDFTASGTGGARATVGTPAGSGATYIIPIAIIGAAASGSTISLTVAGGTGANIRDLAGNLFMAGAGATSTAYSIPTSPISAAPEIAVSGNGVDIVQGDATPNNADFTDFGSVAIDGTIQRDFLISNPGSNSLSVGSLSISGVNAADFSVATPPPASVAAGASASFTLRFRPSAVATRTARVSFVNSDADESPFEFTIQGTGVSAPVPVISTAGVSGVVGTAIAPVVLSATNGPTSWSAPGLATYGLSIDSNGRIAGTPTTAAPGVAIQVTASNANGPGVITIVVTIAAAPATGGGAITPPPAGGGGGGAPVGPPPVVGGGGGGGGGGGAIAPPSPRTNQTITFNSPVSSIFVGRPTQLGATATSGLQVTYTATGNATIKDDTITVHSAGDVIVTAHQSGNSGWNAAAPVPVALTAIKSDQSITLSSLADVPATSGPITIDARASSGLPITLSVSGPARLDGTTVSFNGTPGMVTITATQSGDDAYNPAANVTRTFNVRAGGPMVFFGKLGTDDLAAGITGSKGILIVRIASSGTGIVARFNVAANGSFTTQAAPAAGQTYTVNGTLTDGVLIGTIAELNQRFTANVQSSLGPIASSAGVYTASIPGSAFADSYLVVGPDGRAFAVAILGSRAEAGAGTVSSAGEVNVIASNGTTITGAIDAGRLGGVLRGAGGVSTLVGLNEAALRTDRIINLSSRLRVDAGDASRAVIAGFVVTGTEPKRVLVRAVGPGLAGFGVAGALANPSLQIYHGTRLVAENNDWGNNSEVTSIGESVGAFRLGNNSADAAIVATLPPGAYTAVVQPNGGRGVALIEVYNASANTAPGEQLVNISTRGFVDTGDGQLIAGFVVSGNAPKRVLIRGIGPGLNQFNVPGVVTDPMLRVYAADGTTVIAQNDDWSTPLAIAASQSTATAAEIGAASGATGAFPLAANSKDAALVITLLPGQYSAVMSGASNGTGAGLVEIYELR